MKYIVYGLGISGNGACRLLDKYNKEYIVVDDKLATPTSEAIDLLKDDDIIIKSPGIAWTTKFLELAKSRNIKIISEIDLACEYVNKKTKLICVTGTNGKTTIVTKIYELLKFANKKVMLGGNEGHSFCNIISEDNDYDYIVLELSSYQLENNPLIKPYIAFISNLTPDHLLRYESLEEYYITKMNIFKNQTEDDYAILNEDDKVFFKYFKGTLAKKIYITDKKDYISYNEEYIIDKKELSLLGEHNASNMNFVINTAKIIGIDTDTIRAFMTNTKPLEHRLENFYVKDNMVFINDSKATNVESTLVALDSVKNYKNIYHILGGQDKKIDNTKLYNKILEIKPHILLIGENSLLHKKHLDSLAYADYLLVNDIDTAISEIKRIDSNEETYVLLSPATASFDQFKSFEHRGRYFKEKVKEQFDE